MQTFTLSQAAERIPAVNGRTVHPATVWRWATTGVRGVKLRSQFVGGRRVTTNDDIQKFLADLSGEGSDDV